MNLFKRLNDCLARLEEGLLVTIVIFMVLFAFLQVILRNVLDHSLGWGDILLRHLVLWVGFLGASLATKDERHINIDVFGRMLKGKIKILVQMIINLFALYVTLLLIRAATVFVLSEREYGSVIFNDIPAWYFQIIIPIGFSLIALRLILLTLEKSAELLPRRGSKR